MDVCRYDIVENVLCFLKYGPLVLGVVPLKMIVYNAVPNKFELELFLNNGDALTHVDALNLIKYCLSCDKSLLVNTPKYILEIKKGGPNELYLCLLRKYPLLNLLCPCFRGVPILRLNVCGVFTSDFRDPLCQILDELWKLPQNQKDKQFTIQELFSAFILNTKEKVPDLTPYCKVEGFSSFVNQRWSLTTRGISISTL